MRIKRLTALVLLAVILLAALPLLLAHGDFGGTDGVATTTITDIAPGYIPWFQPLLKPPPETESMLFALQASLGAGVIGYIIGLFKGRKEARRTNAQKD